MKGALRSGVTVQEIQEVLLHTLAYCGTPVTSSSEADPPQRHRRSHLFGAGWPDTPRASVRLKQILARDDPDRVRANEAVDRPGSPRKLSTTATVALPVRFERRRHLEANSAAETATATWLHTPKRTTVPPDSCHRLQGQAVPIESHTVAWASVQECHPRLSARLRLFRCA